MYMAYMGDAVLHDPLNDTARIYDATISQTTDSYSTLNFTIAPSHPLRNQFSVNDASKRIDVTFDGELVFRGVATSITNRMDGQADVSCVSELAYLSWVYTRFQQPQSKYTRLTFASLVALYNSYANIANGTSDEYSFVVDPQSKAHEVGIINEGAAEAVCESEHPSPDTVLSIIVDDLLKPFGAYLRLRYGADGTRYIGLFPDAPETNSQVIQFGENMTDLELTISSDGMYNACFPVGGAVSELESDTRADLKVKTAAKPGDTSIVLTGDNVPLVVGGVLLIGKGSFVVNGASTVTPSGVSVSISPTIPYDIKAGASVRYLGKNLTYLDGTLTLSRAGHDYHYYGGETYLSDNEIVYNVASVREYGLRCMTYQDNSILDVYDLLHDAIARIHAAKEPDTTLTVGAVDAALYGSGFKHLLAGQKVRVISDPHGIDLTMQVASVDLDMDDPGNTTYTLGVPGSTLTRSVNGTESNVRAVRNNMVIELNNRVTTASIGELM